MRLFAWTGLLVIGLVGAGPVLAQTAPNWNPDGLQLTRQNLEDLSTELQRVIESSAYSGSLRDRAQRDLDRITARLALGDFRVGDRIFIDVEGETNIPDSLPVEPGPRITLPVIGSISLAGVLRSELQDHLTVEIGKFIHLPIVHARSMIRLSIQGNVARPGFYSVPSETLLGDALMLAGGPTAVAKLDELQLMRGQEVLWEGDELQGVIADGRTLDQMSIQAGDQLYLPGQTQSFLRTATGYLITAATTLTVTLIARRR